MLISTGFRRGEHQNKVRRAFFFFFFKASAPSVATSFMAILLTHTISGKEVT